MQNKNKLGITLFILSFSLLLLSCNSGKAVSNKNIAPAYARVISTVVSIDSTIYSTKENDPCSKAPCRAKIEIDSILGYGSSFGTVLSKNKILEVKFAYSVAETSMNNNKTKKYDGVTVGSKIIADIERRKEIKSTENNYIIYGYTLIK